MQDRRGAWRRLATFSLAGAAGFVVDAGVLMAGLSLGLPAWAARIPSFLSAVVTTWSINRRLTFAAPGPPSLAEFAAYLGAMSLGLAINLAGYLAALTAGLSPVASLIPATLGGMLANYLGARRVLEGRRPRGRAAPEAPRRDHRGAP